MKIRINTKLHFFITVLLLASTNWNKTIAIPATPLKIENPKSDSPYRLLLSRPLLFLYTITDLKDPTVNGTDKVRSEIKELVSSNPSQAIIHIDQYLYNEPEKALLPYLHQQKGYAYQNLNEYKKSNRHLIRALELFDKKEHSKDIINTEIQISSNYAQMNEQTKAIKFATNTLEKINDIEDKNFTSSVYSLLSHIYYRLGQSDVAVEYLKTAEDLQHETNNLAQLSVTFNNLGILYRIREEYDKSIEYNEKSLELNIKLNDVISQAKSFNNLGTVYRDMKDYDTAEAYYQKAININDSLNIANSNPYTNIASLYHEKKEYKAEAEALAKALQLEQDAKRLDVKKSIFQSLLKNSILNETLDKSFWYQNNIELIDAEITQRQNEEKLEFIKAQQDILDNELKLQSEVQRNKTYQYIIIGVFLLIPSLIIIYIQQRKQQQMKTRQMKSDLENQVLRSQMNPHFIFNTLTIIQNSVINNDALKAASSISKFAKLIRQNFELTQKDLVSLDLDLDVLKNYIDTQQMRFDNSFDYHFNIDIQDRSDNILLPPMLLQPFIENAIEHGIKTLDKQGEIMVIIKQISTQKISFKVIDNGVGYHPKKDGRLHATDIIKSRLALNNPKDAESFYIKNNKNNQGTEVGFLLTVKLKNA